MTAVNQSIGLISSVKNSSDPVEQDVQNLLSGTIGLGKCNLQISVNSLVEIIEIFVRKLFQ